MSPVLKKNQEIIIFLCTFIQNIESFSKVIGLKLTISKDYISATAYLTFALHHCLMILFTALTADDCNRIRLDATEKFW